MAFYRFIAKFRGRPQAGHPFAMRNTVVLLAGCLAALMLGLEISSVPVILPTLRVALQGEFSGIQWIMNAYIIACTAALMATGTLADRYGRKRVFLYTIALFGFASLLCGLAWSMPVLIASRFLQGASGGAMLICLAAVLSHQFPEAAERGRALGICGIVFGIGLGFGPTIGGLIAAMSGWTWVFWVQVFIAALTFGLAIIGVRESRDPHARRLDLAGIVTLSLAVLGLACFVTQGADTGFHSASALSVFAASAASFVLFLGVEMRTAQPMFDFSIFRDRNFSGALLGSVGMNFSFWPFIIYLPIYFQSALGQGPAATGVSLLAYTLPTLVFSPIGERLALRYRPGIVIPAGLFVIGLGFFLMLIGSGIEQASWLTMLPGCLLAGAGLGLTHTPVTHAITGSVSSARAGMASGMDMSARMISLAINIALMGFLLVQGVLQSLRIALSKPSDEASWRALANSIASGNLPPANAGSWPMSAEPLAAIGRAALVHGFGGIMLYGGIAVWVCAGVSLMIFSRRGAQS